MFKFQLSQKVVISCSGESAEIVGRAEYLSSSNQYHCRYRCADGRAVEQWWAEEALAEIGER